MEDGPGYSYWDHYCAVIGVKDVLEHDIKGSGVAARLKRWWWDLFLVSNRCHHTKVVYSSSHALRLERLRHYRSPWVMIHPLSRFRHFWDIWMLRLLIVYDFLFHINTSVIYGDITVASYILNAFIEFLRIVNIFINMSTGFVHKETRRVVLDRHEVITNYCSSKLFFHCLSAMPHTWIMFIRYGGDIACGLCKANKFVGAMKYLNLFNLLRIYELSEIIVSHKNGSNLYFRLLRISVLGFMTMMQYRELTDISMLYLMVANDYIVENSRVGIILFIKYISVATHWNKTYELCLYDISRLFKLFFIYSFNPTLEYIADHLVCLIGMVIANLFYLWTTIECYDHMANKLYPYDNIIRMEKCTLNMIRNRQLTDKVALKIRKNYKHNIAHLRMIRFTNKIMRALPTVLKNDAILESYGKFLSRIPFFSLWPDHVILDLVLLVKEKVFQVNDCLSEPWLQSEGLYIVIFGELAKYNNSIETDHLIDGDYFSELSLVTDEDNEKQVIVAIRPTLIIVLKKIPFRTYMRAYPALFIALRNYLLRKYNLQSVSSIPSMGYMEEIPEKADL